MRMKFSVHTMGNYSGGTGNSGSGTGNFPGQIRNASPDEVFGTHR
jgi:hypothetical protein